MHDNPWPKFKLKKYSEITENSPMQNFLEDSNRLSNMKEFLIKEHNFPVNVFNELTSELNSDFIIKLKQMPDAALKINGITCNDLF